MASYPGNPGVMSPPPVYPQNPDPRVNDPRGAEGPQVMPNPQLQVNVHPQHAMYPQGVQMQQMPFAKPQLRAGPIGALNRGPAPVCCPACQVVGLTAISYQSGEATHLWAALLCFCFCLGCIPYMIETWKDVVHKCSNCGAMLATWRKNGGIEVHMHG